MGRNEEWAALVRKLKEVARAVGVAAASKDDASRGQVTDTVSHTRAANPGVREFRKLEKEFALYEASFRSAATFLVSPSVWGRDFGAALGIAC